MEFITTTEVLDRGKHRFLRILLGVICFLDILYSVIGHLIDERIGLFPIVLLLICVLTFRKLGDRKHVEDVRCIISETEPDFHLTMFDIANDKENVYSRRYRIDKKKLQVLTDQKKGVIDLSGDGNVKLFTKDGQTVYEEDYTEQIIELTVTENAFKELVGLLKDYIKPEIYRLD